MQRQSNTPCMNQQRILIPLSFHDIPARVQLEVAAGVYEDHNGCPPLDFALMGLIDSFDTCSIT